MQDFYLKARENFAVKKAVADGITITRNYEKIWGSKEKKGNIDEGKDKGEEEKPKYKKQSSVIVGYILWSFFSFVFDNFIFYFFPFTIIVFPIVDLNSTYCDFNSA